MAVKFAISAPATSLAAVQAQIILMHILITAGLHILQFCVAANTIPVAVVEQAHRQKEVCIVCDAMKQL